MTCCDRWTALAFVLSTALACDRAPAVDPTAAETPAAPEAAPVGPDGLTVGQRTAFGLPIPEGAVEEEVGETHAYYSIQASYRDVTLFFENQLPDFSPQDYREGRKLVASDSSDRSLYIFRESDSEVLITYFDETSQGSVYRSSAAELAAELDRTQPDRRVATDGSHVVSANRPRERQPLNGTVRTTESQRPRWEDGDRPEPDAREERPRMLRGTTNPNGSRPLDFVHGEYIAPQNPAAFY